MANVFAVTSDPSRAYIQLSNRATAVMIELFSLASTAIAASPAQIELASWISSHDQGVYGLGIVGFDLVEIPWSRDPREFESQRAHLHSMLKEVEQKRGWEKLDYEPQQETVSEILSGFRSVINDFVISDIPVAVSYTHLTLPTTPYV